MLFEFEIQFVGYDRSAFDSFLSLLSGSPNVSEFLVKNFFLILSETHCNRICLTDSGYSILVTRDKDGPISGCGDPLKSATVMTIPASAPIHTDGAGQYQPVLFAFANGNVLFSLPFELPFKSSFKILFKLELENANFLFFFAFEKLLNKILEEKLFGRLKYLY